MDALRHVELLTNVATDCVDVRKQTSKCLEWKEA